MVPADFRDFYDGIAHVAATPADLLVALAMALLAGQSGAKGARHAAVALPAMWFAGGILGAHRSSAGAMALPTTLSLAIAGALGVLNARVRDAGIAVPAVPDGI